MISANRILIELWGEFKKQIRELRKSMAPFYDYRCESCGKTDEFMVSRDKVETEVKSCPDCGKEMKRLLSAPEFKLYNSPPKGYKPLSKSNPKSHIEPIRRKSI